MTRARGVTTPSLRSSELVQGEAQRQGPRTLTVLRGSRTRRLSKRRLGNIPRAGNIVLFEADMQSDKGAAAASSPYAYRDAYGTSQHAGTHMGPVSMPGRIWDQSAWQNIARTS